MRQVKTAATLLAIGALGATGWAADRGPDAPRRESSRRADLVKAGAAGGAWIFQGPAPLEGGQVENIGSNDPVTGAVQSVVAHPTNANILYVGTVNGGVWKTTNATSASPTWTPLTDAESSLSIGAISFDTNDAGRTTIVAGVGRRSSYGFVGGPRTGLLRSTDGGTSWTRLTGLAGQNISGIAAAGATLVVSVNFSDSNTCGSLGIFRSTNTGASFTQVGIANGMPAGRSFDLAVDPAAPSTLYSSTVFANTCSGVPNGLFKSTDGGANWSRIGNPTIEAQILDSTTSNLKLSVGAAGTVFAGIINSGRLSGVFRSTNGGATWTQLDTPSTNEGGTQVGLNPSDEPGEPLTPPGEPVEPGSQGEIHFSMQADPINPNIVYLGGDRQPGGFPNGIGALNYSGRIFRLDASLPPGSQSAPLTHCASTAPVSCNAVSTTNNSAPHADSRDMAMAANGVLIEVDDGGVYRRTNPTGVGNWFPLNGSLGSGELHDASYDTVSNIVLSGNQDIGSGEQASTGITTWRTVNQGDGGDTAVDIMSVSGSSVRYTSAQNLIVFQRRTVNAANVVTSTIFPSLAGSISGQFNTPVEVNAVDPLRLAFLGANGVYESFNQGTTVSLVSTAVANGFLGDPVSYGGFSAGVPNSDVLYVGVDSTVRLRTTGAGSLVPTGALPGISPGDDVVDVVLDPTEWRTAYVVTAFGRVYGTTNAGASWTDVTGDIPLQDGNAIAYAPGPEGDSVYASGGGGVFRMLTSAPGDWQTYGTGLPRALVYDLDFDTRDDVLLASTMGRGSWLIRNASCQAEECDGIDNDCDGGIDEVCATCGDGIVEPPEACDDSNTVGGDGCSADCSSDESCGNGIVDPGEMCDDGNTNDDDACANDCTLNPVTNIVINGDFAAGTAPWVHFTNGSGSFTVVGGEAQVSFGSVNGTSVQLYQRSINGDSNTEYTLTFRARHTATNAAERKIVVRFARHTLPFTFYGLTQQVTLSNTMQTYSFDFTTPGIPITDGRLTFSLSSADPPGTSFFLDDVVLALAGPQTCGNGTLDGGEVCDGANLDGETCVTQGFDGGTLACNATCDGFVTSGCFACGDNVINGTEVCDGTALGGQSCASQGFDGGTLACNPTCDAYDTSACTECGDGTVDAGEQCDDGNTANGDGCSATCQIEGGGPNLIANGSFSAGTAGWRFSTNANATFSVVGGEAFIDVTTAGTSVQLYQAGITLTPNRTYRLTFRGRNTGGRDVRVRMIRHTSPYNSYGLDQVANLTTTMQTFTMTFSTPSGPLFDARLQLWLAPYDFPGDDWYFDDFVLQAQ